MASTLSSTASRHTRTSHFAVALPRPGAMGTSPSKKVGYTSMPTPMLRSGTAPSSTGPMSAAETASSPLGFSSGSAKISTNSSTAVSSGRKISAERNSAFAPPSAAMRLNASSVTTNGQWPLNGYTVVTNRSAPLRSKNAAYSKNQRE